VEHEREHEHEREQETAGWVKGAVWALGIGVPLLISGLGAWFLLTRSDALSRDERLDQRVDIIEQRISTLAAAVQSHAITDESQDRLSALWQARVGSNEQLLRAISSDVGTISRNRQAVDDMQKRVSQLERNCDKLEWVSQEVNRIMDYFKRHGKAL
jgi:uncharacterized protein Yka (UPF0111/DUF47 family)